MRMYDVVLVQMRACAAPFAFVCATVHVFLPPQAEVIIRLVSVLGYVSALATAAVSLINHNANKGQNASLVFRSYVVYLRAPIVFATAVFLPHVQAAAPQSV